MENIVCERALKIVKWQYKLEHQDNKADFAQEMKMKTSIIL